MQSDTAGNRNRIPQIEMLVGQMGIMIFIRLIDQLNQDLASLRFKPPITYVYNPLEYARSAYIEYVQRYAMTPEVVFVGMNPGPWGMVQTGIPFGEVDAVKTWLKIDVPVGKPARIHPSRPVYGPQCKRREVSGQRLWGWARATFKTPQKFFKRCFVANYCPLMFIEAAGRNRTPDRLPAVERRPLFAACDKALRGMIEHLQPSYVVGIGRFAENRVAAALKGFSVSTGGITHPSPANPKANRDWGALITSELTDLGIRLS